MTKSRDLANLASAGATVSATELGYVDGVTSAIQTQIDTKAPSSTAVTLTGTQTLTNKTLTSPVIASVINNTLTTTTGDIIYASAANTPARLGIGSSAQVLTVASGIPSWATASGGGTKIGQVVQTFLSTTFSTASSSYTDLTGLSVSITPTLNTSKILVFVSITQSTSTGTAGNTFFQILRGATAIGNSTGVSVVSFSGLAGAMMPTSGSIDTNCVFLDSPATTSATTYKIQMKNDGGYTAYINRRGADTNSGGVSTITVMEVVA